MVKKILIAVIAIVVLIVAVNMIKGCNAKKVVVVPVTEVAK